MTAGFSDFTETAYRDVLAAAMSGYRFEPYGTTYQGRHAIWRHDVDISPHRALRIAEIEAELGVTSTYCFWLHSPFYNLFERSVADCVSRIFTIAEHRMGVHFESGHYGSRLALVDIAEHLDRERRLLEELIERPAEMFSFHNPGARNDDLAIDEDRVQGLVNAYGRTLRDTYSYVSDSNGYWRHSRLEDVVTAVKPERLHVLTHAEWWQIKAMPPRAKVVRAVEGRAASVLRQYDDALAALGRENIR